MIDPDAWPALVLLACPALALLAELTPPGSWLGRALAALQGGDDDG